MGTDSGTPLQSVAFPDVCGLQVMPATPFSNHLLDRSDSYEALQSMPLDNSRFSGAGTPAPDLKMPPTPARSAINHTNPKQRLTRQDTLLDTKVQMRDPGRG